MTTRMLRHKITFAALAPFLLVARATTLRSQAGADTLPDALRSRIESIVERERKAADIPGLSLAIGEGGKAIYSKGFGFADLEHSIPAKADTVYRTASIAKAMTATAIMQLVEKERIGLSDPVQKSCPSFPEKEWPITVHHLLAHQSGIRHYAKPNESNGTEHFFALSDSLKIFKDDALLHEPGTKFTYSTFGYSVLGCVIEGTAGTSYAEYMAEHVFKPAGMERTRTDDHFEIVRDRARGYMKLSREAIRQLPEHMRKQATVGQLLNAPLSDTSMKVSGGGLLSTAPDLVRFGLAFLGDRLVSAKTRELMWTVQKTKDGEDTAMHVGKACIGWFHKDAGGARFMYASGGQAGTRTSLYVHAGKGLVLAVMANLQNAPLDKMEQEVLAALLAER